MSNWQPIPSKLLAQIPKTYAMADLVAEREAMRARGIDVLDVSIGELHLAPDPQAREALARAAADVAFNRYPELRGSRELRAAFADLYRRRYGVELDPDREVAVLPGTKTGIVELSLVLADEGETVLLPDPYYPDYPSGPSFAGARLGTFPLDADAGWAPHLDEVEAAAALYLNYPSNPCAVCAAGGVFEDAVRWAERTGGAIVHDAAYIDLVYDGRVPASFLATPGAKDVGVEMWSMSKTYGMAGWRIGFVVGNAEIVERINLLNDHARVGIFEPMQRATIAALEGPQESVAGRVATYQRRRDLLADALRAPIVCEGTFFVWLRLPEELTAERLLEEHRVAVAPGEGFGPSGAGWARISLAVPDDVLELGAERLAEAFAGIVV